MDSLKDPRLIVPLLLPARDAEGFVQLEFTRDLVAELYRLQTLATRYDLLEAVVEWPGTSCWPDEDFWPPADLEWLRSGGITPRVAEADWLYDDESLPVTGCYLHVSWIALTVCVGRDNDDDENHRSPLISLDEIYQIAENLLPLGRVD
jgi:hypothetical protein